MRLIVVKCDRAAQNPAQPASIPTPQSLQHFGGLAVIMVLEVLYRAMGTRTNESWSVDFISNQLCDGRCFRLLTIMNDFTRESLAIEVASGLCGNDVTRVLDRIKAQ